MKNIIKELYKAGLIKVNLNESTASSGLLKAIIMAGGPGAGKSTIIKQLFGVDDILAGTSIRTGLRTVNSDPAFEYFLKKMGINPKKLGSMSPEEFSNVVDSPTGPRQKAVAIRDKMKDMYTSNRLGVILDGTGADYQYIKEQKELLENLGYDVCMVFVNTSLDVALYRNSKRGRVLPDYLVKAKWKEVQDNLGKFQTMFGSNMLIVDNTENGPIQQEKIIAIDKFLKQPIKNPIGVEWLKMNKKYIREQLEPSRTIAVYPGRFQPPGLHHYKAYEWLANKFGKQNAYVATTDKVEIPNSPFTFIEKQNMWNGFYGVQNVAKVKNPYIAEELLKMYDPKTTSVVFMVGEKDMKDNPRFNVGLKKSGDPTYFQMYDESKPMEGYDKHAYLIIAPHIALSIPGYGELSGTQIRNVIRDADINDVDLFVKLFGKYEPKLIDLVVNKIKNSVTEQYWDTFLNSLLQEGGAAGHMPYAYELPNVNTGNDLIKIHNKVIDSVTTTPPAVKVDGLNTDVRLIELDGVKQFVMDRGSKNILDVKGLTKADLLNRFGEGHGMIKIGGEVLDIFNSALPVIKNDLKQLGLWDNPNLLFNIEYVSGTSNIVSYKNKFLAIHNVLELVPTKTGARKPQLYPTDKNVLENMVKKMKPIAKRFGYEIYGTIPATPKTTKANLNKPLSASITIPLTPENKESKPLSAWLSGLKIPHNQKVSWNGQKGIPAISKKIFNSIYSGIPISTGTDNESEQMDILSGYITFLATMLFGQEILNNLTSSVGDMDNQEGLVINDPSVSNTPFKIIGSFITKSPEMGAPTAKIIKEGGNVFKVDGIPVTTRINKVEVLPTVKWLESITHLPLINNMLGTTGVKDSSGDLDLAVDEKKISKEQLAGLLASWVNKNGFEIKDYIRKSGDSVHFKTPIQGRTGEFVQTDFMFGDPEWMKWSLKGSPIYSNYTGKLIHIVFSSIAKARGYKWSHKDGLLDRMNNMNFVTKDPDEMAKIVLDDPMATKADIESVENMLDKIKDDPNYDALIADAKETAERIHGIKLPSKSELQDKINENNTYNISGVNTMEKQDLLREALRNEIKRVLVTEAFIDPWKQIMDVLDQTHEVRRSLLDDTIKLNLYPDQETADEVKRAYQLAKELEVLLNTILPKYKDMPIKEK